ncbi:MAG: SnoaL-like domain-containing protein [Candidatus Omnitrophica bacterium]|nr:SnoaL-like domain-containing protein [Candidatus Omnitrophota bacterium]
MKRYSAVLIMAGVLLVFAPRGFSQTADELKALHEQYVGYLTAHDLEKCKTMHAPGFVYDLVPMSMTFSEPEWQYFWTDFLKGFPDFKGNEGVILVSGNILIMEHTISGTHKEVWNGIPPTGKNFPSFFPHLDVWEFEGTKIKKVTTYGDMQGVLITLGAMPAPELPPLTPSFTLPDPVPTGLSFLNTPPELGNRFNAHNPVEMTKMIAKDADIVVTALGKISREEFGAVQEMYVNTFADVKVEVLKLVDFGDGWIYSDEIYTGTHTAPYFGFPATGRKFQLRSGDLYRVTSDGLISYAHYYWDHLGLLTQLGILPTSSAKTGEMYK